MPSKRARSVRLPSPSSSGHFAASLGVASAQALGRHGWLRQSSPAKQLRFPSRRAALLAQRGASATGAYVSLGGPEWVTYRQQLRSALSDADQVVGAVVAHNGTLVHAEMFGDPNLAAISRAVALDGYARDGVAMGATTESLPDEEVVEAFLFSHLEDSDTVSDF